MMEMLPVTILMEALPVCAMKAITEMVKYAHLLVRLHACDNWLCSKILSDQTISWSLIVNYFHLIFVDYRCNAYSDY